MGAKQPLWVPGFRRAWKVRTRGGNSAAGSQMPRRGREIMRRAPCAHVGARTSLSTSTHQSHRGEKMDLLSSGCRGNTPSEG